MRLRQSFFLKYRHLDLLFLFCITFKKITPILGYCFFTFLFCFVFPGVYDWLFIFLTLFAFITARTFSFKHFIISSISIEWTISWSFSDVLAWLRMVIYLDWWTVVFLGLFRCSSDLELLFPASRLFLFSGSHPSLLVAGLWETP